MNPFVWTVQCQVCGGPGAGDTNAILASWGREPGRYKFGPSTVAHRNPAICRSYIARQRRELDARLAELGKEVSNAAHP